MIMIKGWASEHFLGALLAVSVSTPVFAQPAPSGQQQLIAANSGFSFRLFSELVREQSDANVFISPYSISTVLQMLSDGAGGQTEAELRQVLGTTGLSQAEMNQAHEGLDEIIRSAATNAVLNLANALWYRNDARLSPQFAAANQEFFHATVDGLDFAAPEAVQQINHWAARNTQGRIQEVIQPPIPPETAMVIANAIYFKGTWQQQFDLKQTQPRAFYFRGGGQAQVPMMRQTRSFEYLQTDRFQAVQLLYSGRDLAMQVVLPQTNTSLATLVSRLDPSFWHDTLLAGFREHRGTLVLPRFQLRFSAELKPTLSALGLKSIWGAAADFSNMSQSRLFVSEVKHQSFVDVNEQGTEAAAVTSGVMALASVRNPAPPFEMTVDRPFLFVISHRATGSILFIGAVFRPNPAGG